MVFPEICPFCGVTPEVHPFDPKTEGNAWGKVVCVNERCPAQPSVEDTALGNDERGSQRYKALAIKVWNRALRRTRENRSRIPSRFRK